jgi:hypothetical protein
MMLTKLCDHKERFISRMDAETRAVRMLRSGRRLFAYACPHCPNWHLTSQVPKLLRPVDTGTMAVGDES